MSGKSFARFPLDPTAANGQSLSDRVHELEVNVQDPANEEIGYKVIRDDDGFAILFQPLVPGDYTVTVRHQGQNIRDSPFAVPIGTDKQRELIEKLHGGNAPLPQAKFSVTPKSTATGAANLLETNSVADFTLAIESPTGQALDKESIRLTASGTHTLDVIFRPPVPGIYTIQIECKGEPILNSPFRLQVAPPPGMTSA